MKSSLVGYGKCSPPSKAFVLTLATLSHHGSRNLKEALALDGVTECSLQKKKHKQEPIQASKVVFHPWSLTSGATSQKMHQPKKGHGFHVEILVASHEKHAVCIQFEKLGLRD